jgi:hypothetical protein
MHGTDNSFWEDPGRSWNEEFVRKLLAQSLRSLFEEKHVDYVIHTDWV